MTPLWGVIPANTAGLDHLDIVMKALLAYLFIPGEPTGEFIERLLQVVQYLRQSVTLENDEEFVQNLIQQLDNSFGSDLTNFNNLSDLSGQLNDNITSINEALPEDPLELREWIQTLLLNMIWLTSSDSEGGRLLVNILSLVDNAATTSIKSLQNIKEIIKQNQKDIIKCMKFNHQKRMERKLKKIGICPCDFSNNESLLLEIFRMFLTKEPDRKFFSDKARIILKVISATISRDQIHDLSVSLRSSSVNRLSYLQEDSYDSLESLIVAFFHRGGTRRQLVQALRNTLGAAMEQTVDQIKEAVCEEPPLNIEPLFNGMTISAPATLPTPQTSEVLEPSSNNNELQLSQSPHTEIIEEFASFLRDNQTENASFELLNTEVISMIYEQLTPEQVEQFAASLRSGNPGITDNIPHNRENFSTLIREYLLLSSPDSAYRNLASELYTILEKKLTEEGIKHWLEDCKHALEPSISTTNF